MLRTALVALALAVAPAVRAADLPTGTWAVNVDGNKGDLVIKEVKGGKVTGVLIDTDFTGTWNGKELKFLIGDHTYEAQLVSEPGEKGKTKYTLTGARSQTTFSPNRAAPGIHVVKTGGWYAQLSAAAPALGEIKAEVRGVLTLTANNTTAYITVARKGEADEVRVWLWNTEAEWKANLKDLTALDGKEVIVTGKLSLYQKDAKFPIPGGALYVPGNFDIKAAQPK
jgi:hypothetical protein